MGPQSANGQQGETTFVQPQHAAVQPPVRSYWEAGLFDCFQDCGLCCDVCWCSCCAAGRLFNAMDNRPDSMNVPVCCGLLVGEWLIGIFAQCLLTLYIRDKVRTKYSISGSGCGDCCASFWCATCVMCQTHRELSSRGVSPGYTCCEPSVKYNTHPVPVGAQAIAQPAYVGQQQPVVGQPRLEPGQ